MSADRDRLAATLDVHVTGAEAVGDRQLRLTCACGEWSDEFAVVDSPSLQWAEAHARWRLHRADALLPVVDRIANERAAAELRAAADEYAHPFLQSVHASALRSRADALDPT